MFKLNVVAVGKIKEKYFSEAIEEYKKRLSRFCDFSIIEIKEENFVSEPDGAEIERIIEMEGDEILKRAKGHIIAMTIDGKKLDSKMLSCEISSRFDKGEETTFVIGGSYGLSQKVKNAAKQKFSFSDLTFPHTLFRVMLTEQIYRAFMIKNGSSYHK